jgi:hypothetical protein
MTTAKSELAWTYEPTDFLESPAYVVFAHGELHADEGKANYTLSTPTDPLPAELRNAIVEEVRYFFDAARFVKHIDVKLSEPSEVQYDEKGGRSVSAALMGQGLTLRGGLVSVLIEGPGEIVRDSRVDRIQSEMAFIGAVTPKMAHSEPLRRMLQSYGQAVRDPANELVHLYEVTDAITKYFDGGANTLKALPAVRGPLKALGQLSNNPEIRQGRHRGRRIGPLRDATDSELADARLNVRKMIEAFAAVI